MSTCLWVMGRAQIKFEKQKYASYVEKKVAGEGNWEFHKEEILM